MEQFSGGVAVVTGAGSGIGRALADRFASEHMRVAIADVEADALDETRAGLEAAGADVLAVTVDVSDRDAVLDFARQTHERFGPATVLCNNAGVGGGGRAPVWELTPKDWDWVLGVNLMGVVHGIQSFVPAMVDAGAPAHVVNTASIFGLATTGPTTYGVSKHGVVRLSEGLWYDLRAAEVPIGVSVLCPAMVATNIVTSGRNRPEHLRNDVVADPEAEELLRAADAAFKAGGMPPNEVAGIVVDAIRSERFYVLTHPESQALVDLRFDAIRDGQRPPRQPRLGG